MNFWNKLVGSRPATDQASQKPANMLETLTKAQIIAKLAELPWQETRTGIPGVANAKLNDEQKIFLHQCSQQGLVCVVSSASLGGAGYYCYNPGAVAAIEIKEEFKQQTGDAELKEATRQFIKHEIPAMAALMKDGEKIPERGLPTTMAIDVNDQGKADNILKIYDKFPKDSGLKLHYSQGQPSGYRFSTRNDSLGHAVLGQLYLDGRAQQKDRGL